MQLEEHQTDSAFPFGRRHLLYLLLLFLLALLPRVFSVQHLGWDWDGPGSFTLVNFDEGGSCRAALQGFDYSTFIGRQTIAIASLLGAAPPADIAGDFRAVKTYCHSRAHVRVARTYSAIAGALTPVVLVVIALLLLPARPGVAWTAGILLALSGFHMSESHSGTVDAPSVFYIYTFLALMTFAVARDKFWVLLTSPLLLLPAVWTKYWVFAFFAYLAVLPMRVWQYLFHGMSPIRVACLVLATATLFSLLTNHDFLGTGFYPLLALWYLLVPWRRVHRPMAIFWLVLPPLAWLLCRVDVVSTYTTGGEPGMGYAVIGWHKWLRNLTNLPLVLIVGLGLPACLFLPLGIRELVRQVRVNRAWLCLAPVLIFAIYMALLAPVTYYRHYLPLLPAAALLAAMGVFATKWASRRWFMALFFVWPALLAIDLMSDYHHDPRIELRQWYRENPGARVFFSYYVNPPRGSNRLFQPEFAEGEAEQLRQATHLILSENWYDTAYANELNGPVTGDLSRLVKTNQTYARFYRDALAGRHPYLEYERLIALSSFMPELYLHQMFYGNFQLFVGDLVILKVRD